MTATARQMFITGTFPGFGSVIPAAWSPANDFVYNGLPLSFTFDHAITTTNAAPTAQLRILKDGAAWRNFTPTSSQIIIQGNVLRIPLWPPANCRLSVTIDPDFVKGVEAQSSPAYFLGTKGRSLVFDVMAQQLVSGATVDFYGRTYSVSNNFTLALDSDLNYFTAARFCAAITNIVWSIECSKVSAIIIDYYLPIVMFQFIRMADQTAADAEALVLQAQASGYLSKMMQRQGLGAILPGSFNLITAAQTELRNVSITLTPNNVTAPTSVLFVGETNQALPSNAKLEIVLPFDFQVVANSLEVAIGDPAVGTPTVYRASSAQVTIGAFGPTSIWVDTAGLPVSPQVGAGNNLVIRITQGVSMPATCLGLSRWVWIVRIYTSTNSLTEYTVINPNTDTCTGIPIRVGVPDGAPLRTTFWLNARPSQSIVNEPIRVRFFGFRFSGPQFGTYAKIAALADNTCMGVAPGTTVAVLDADASAVFTVTHEGVYDICVRHRTNWEVLPTKFNVQQIIPDPPKPVGTPALFGHQSCQALLEEKPQFCGCYYTDGRPVQDRAIELPLSEPISNALGLSRQNVLLQGCCANPYTKRTAWAVPDRSFLLWGVCSPVVGGERRPGELLAM